MKISQSALSYKQAYVNINDFLLKYLIAETTVFFINSASPRDSAYATHEDFQRAGRGDL
jgi:hypothetical protein